MATISSIDTLDATLASNKPLRKTKFGTNEPVMDDSGNFEWQIEVMVADEIGIDTVKLCTKAPTNPVDGVPPQTPLRFNNVRVMMGTYNRKQWAKLAADSVELAPGKKG